MDPIKQEPRQENTETMVRSFLTDEFMTQEDVEGSGENSDDSRESEGNRKTTPLREQDRFLPIANIAKIMKKAIPTNGKIAKDSRECIQECVSEFISFITSEASERCHQEKRKTINGDDILAAMVALGFENYLEPLTVYLHKYRETTKSERQVSNNSDAASGGDSTTPGFEEAASVPDFEFTPIDGF